MRTVRVERTLDEPVEQVFARLTDHHAYTRLRGVRGATLLREGHPTPGGAGALRRIDLGLVRFEEEILALDPPSTMDYRIVKASFPFEHESGRIACTPTQTGTRVVWETTFSSPLGPLAAAAIRAGFARVIRG